LRNDNNHRIGWRCIVAVVIIYCAYLGSPAHGAVHNVHNIHKLAKQYNRELNCVEYEMASQDDKKMVRPSGCPVI
jgi:hypothetical protein